MRCLVRIVLGGGGCGKRVGGVKGCGEGRVEAVGVFVRFGEAVELVMILNSLNIDCSWRVVYRPESTGPVEEGYTGASMLCNYMIVKCNYFKSEN